MAQQQEQIFDLSNEMRYDFQIFRDDDKDENTDIILVCDNGQTIPAHSVILAARSKYLYQTFKNKGVWSEGSRKTVIPIEGVSYNILEGIVGAAYSHHIFVSPTTVRDLWKATKSLELKLMKKKCDEYILSRITSENREEWLQFAIEARDVEFREKVLLAFPQI